MNGFDPWAYGVSDGVRWTTSDLPGAERLFDAVFVLVIIFTLVQAGTLAPVARLLPFWSAREIGTYAIDLTDDGYLIRGVAHGVAVAVVLSV